MMTSFMKTPMALAWCSVPKIIIFDFFFMYVQDKFKFKVRVSLSLVLCTKKLNKIKMRKKSVLTSKYSFWVQNRVTSFMKTPMAPAWCSVPKIITCQEVIFALKFSSFGVFQGVFPCLTTKSTFLFI